MRLDINNDEMLGFKKRDKSKVLFASTTIKPPAKSESAWLEKGSMNVAIEIAKSD
jgi:hypothetical protein